jgi:hypothetical protein
VTFCPADTEERAEDGGEGKPGLKEVGSGIAGTAGGDVGRGILSVPGIVN